jgi:Uma2 family endonuclease
MVMPLLYPLEPRGPFTVDDYYRMVEVGLLDSHARVELLEGLVVAMTPIGRPHESCVMRLTDRFAQALAGRVSFVVQSSVELGKRSVPQPDLTLATYRRDGYAERHPGPDDALLVIEVMDSSAARDRGLKLPLYARAGIRELWLVDLEEDLVEVYRSPGPDGYAVEMQVVRGQQVTPVFVDGVTLSADDILGPVRPRE